MKTLRLLSLGVGACALAAALSLPQAAHAQGQLHLFNWSNYFPPELMEKFEAETGVSVSLDTYASDEDMLAILAFDLHANGVALEEPLAPANAGTIELGAP